jgi:4-hydroxythreonine-4-phosphate dehydrogenase
MQTMKKLAITMGDPGGIGPEIIVKALSSKEVGDCCTPIVIGDLTVMEEALKLLSSAAGLRLIKAPEDSDPSPGTIEMIDMGGRGDFAKCRPTAKGGRACAGYIRKAVELSLNREVGGMVTAPISKEALKMAGMKWPGHTEMISELTATDNYAMMLAGGPLKVILVTIHTALRAVPDLVTQSSVLKTIRLAKRACDMLGLADPEIAVAGLNPHAGEAGLFGDEESDEILPAVEDAKREGILVSGPFPPDTVFHAAYEGEFDMVVCMYHDQGLIPLKMLAFDVGVNVTVGLPIIRTSPDHGTAYDIAWKGIASPSSMCEAIKLASRLKN